MQEGEQEKASKRTHNWYIQKGLSNRLHPAMSRTKPKGESAAVLNVALGFHGFGDCVCIHPPTQCQEEIYKLFGSCSMGFFSK